MNTSAKFNALFSVVSVGALSALIITTLATSHFALTADVATCSGIYALKLGRSIRGESTTSVRGTQNSR